MAHQVTLVPSQHRFTCEDHESVLEAGLRQGIGLPHGCKSGVCGACKAKVVAGEVAPLGGEPALSGEERARGMALLCGTSARSDLLIELREAAGGGDYPVRITPARVQSMRLAAPEVMIVELKLPANEGFRFRPGQYVDILLKDGGRRSFSIANAGGGGDAALELHVRKVDGGRFTTQVFTAMKPRDILRIEGPLGTFFLREDSAAPVILLAGGTGFAPVKAIVEAAIAAGGPRPMHLYWGAHDPVGLYLDELPQRWAREHGWFRYTPVLSGPVPEVWAGRTGLVHRAVMADYPDLSAFEVYACGSPAMVAAARDDFVRDRGLDEVAFFADAFTFSTVKGQVARGQ